MSDKDLLKILDTMTLPLMRKDITQLGNLLWLTRNMGIQNGLNPCFMVAMVEVKRRISEMSKR